MKLKSSFYLEGRRIIVVMFVVDMNNENLVTEEQGILVYQPPWPWQDEPLISLH